MNYLSVENLSKSYGEKILFNEISFGLDKGDKVALIAANGAGKTTLLNIINGKDFADDGKITLRDGIRETYLEQDPVLDFEGSIRDYVSIANTRLLEVVRKYELALKNQTETWSDENHKAFEMASADMDLHNAWDFERRLTEMLTRFRITGLDQKVNTLSGGQKKRLALALVLMDEPDFLILDEPTNHLDIEMVEWLEKHLMQAGVTLLMVTHDRYFLDRVCDHILELNEGRIYHHNGNYAYYVEKKAAREEVFQTEIHKASRLMKKELEWIRRMPKARTTKSKARIDAFYDLKEKASGKRSEPELKLEVKMTRIGGKILELDKVSKSYGDIKILEDFNYVFKKGERIGILGDNGVGKTTFLNILTQDVKPDSGKVSAGDTIVFGYYSQEGIRIKESKRVIEVITDIAETITLGNGSTLSASQFLNHFMFSPDMQYTYVSKLSGGERRRLYLMTVLIKNPNFLILDEPTNDLDLLTLNKLEDFLENFGGCLIIVTHDRFFLDRLADQLFIFEGDGRIKGFTGTYSEYRLAQEEQSRQDKMRKQVSNDQKPLSGNKVPQEKAKLSYREKKEYDLLEKEIEKLEAEKILLESSLNSADTDYQELEKISVRIGEVMQLIDAKSQRWLELSERAER